MGDPPGRINPSFGSSIVINSNVLRNESVKISENEFHVSLLVNSTLSVIKEGLMVGGDRLES